MSEDKLTRIKAALKLTIELAEKATPVPWFTNEYRATLTQQNPKLPPDSTKRTVLLIHPAIEPKHEDLAYIAHACNLGAPMTKELLADIELFELIANAPPDFENPIERQNQISFRDRLTSIINSFPDNV